ncbi:MAG: D-alanyl-D-alanine carboxypeptidase family protein [Saprospiraceae bacterium]|nr:D-alanyl-D-alanine carboxypeptidase family protein [Saprospiraceae bacterium]
MKVITWLLKNSASYGFCMTYTKFDAQRTTGYQPEKWHWSFTPVSASYIGQNATLKTP